MVNPDQVSLAALFEECGGVECVSEQVFEDRLRTQAAAEAYFSGRLQRTTIYVDARRTVCELKRMQFDWERTDLYQAVRCFKS